MRHLRPVQHLSVSSHNLHPPSSPLTILIQLVSSSLFISLLPCKTSHNSPPHPHLLSAAVSRPRHSTLPSAANINQPLCGKQREGRREREGWKKREKASRQPVIRTNVDRLRIAGWEAPFSFFFFLNKSTCILSSLKKKTESGPESGLSSSRHLQWSLLKSSFKAQKAVILPYGNRACSGKNPSSGWRSKRVLGDCSSKFFFCPRKAIGQLSLQLQSHIDFNSVSEKVQCGFTSSHNTWANTLKQQLPGPYRFSQFSHVHNPGQLQTHHHSWLNCAFMFQPQQWDQQVSSSYTLRDLFSQLEVTEPLQWLTTICGTVWLFYYNHWVPSNF